MNKRREEKEAKKANQFVTTLGSEYDIMGYLAKYRDFMLFNLTDHAYIDVLSIYSPNPVGQEPCTEESSQESYQIMGR